MANPQNSQDLMIEPIEQGGTSSIRRINPQTDPLDALLDQNKQNAASFSDFMSKPNSIDPQVSNNLMEGIPRNANRPKGMVGPANVESILKESQKLAQSIESLKVQLSAPGVQIRGASESLLEGKLSNISLYLKSMYKQLQLPSAPGEGSTLFPSESAQPLKRFISMLSNSQHQLEKMGGEINVLAGKKEFNPGEMMKIQYKMYLVSHNVELFTSLLSKSTESIKTVMNVQN
jgi:hypothetical protein